MTGPIMPIKPPAEFEISWAGPGPHGEGLCFGSESTELLFLTEDAEPLFSISPPVAECGEAINGMAYFQNVVAASTRAEIVFYQPTSKMRARRAVYPIGAHALVALPSGHFVACAGREGLVLARPSAENEEYQVRRIQAAGEQPTFYKTVALHADSGPEFVACAARRAGVIAALISDRSEDKWMRGFGHGELDAVDICSLGFGSAPFAVCALATSGTLVFCRDVTTDEEPVPVSFADIGGVPYRVTCNDGHIILLTSKALYVLFGLADRFMKEDMPDGGLIPQMRFSVEAVDANLVGNRWLLVLTAQEVLRLDLGMLTANGSRNGGGIADFRDSASRRPALKWKWRTGEKVEESKLVTAGNA